MPGSMNSSPVDFIRSPARLFTKWKRHNKRTPCSCQDIMRGPEAHDESVIVASCSAYVMMPFALTVLLHLTLHEGVESAPSSTCKKSKSNLVSFRPYTIDTCSRCRSNWMACRDKITVEVPWKETGPWLGAAKPYPLLDGMPLGRRPAQCSMA